MLTDVASPRPEYFMITKTRIINAILQLNRSAKADWLNKFATDALRRYLDHLQMTIEPRGRTSVWRRSGETPAVVTRVPCW